MKKFVVLCVMGLMVSACQFATAADLKSGLQVDAEPPAFNVTVFSSILRTKTLTTGRELY